MKWSYWTTLYLQTHCTARGLRPLTIKAYQATLEGFRSYVEFRLQNRPPDQLTAADVLQYVDYLRKERDNGASAVNRQVTVLKNFYRAMVAMGHLAARDNPMAYFPKIRPGRRKLPVSYSQAEVSRLMAQPRTDTILGLRDRTMLMLLYATGIRASECSDLADAEVDLQEATIRVVGKGGHERVVPLNAEVAHMMRQYRLARGTPGSDGVFFKSRKGRRLSRSSIYELVRKYGRKARIEKRVSPHRLRHTFATHLVQAGVDLVTLRDLLGHRQITSTQLYIHMTADDLRQAAERHPIGALVNRIDDLLPHVKLPLQKPRPLQHTG